MAPVFLVWLVIYICLMGDMSVFSRPAQFARYLVTGGPAYHLWFLPALGIGIVTVASMRQIPLLLAVLAIGVFLIGLAFGAYREVRQLPDLPIGSRNGPFFSVPFVALGYFCARQTLPPAEMGAILALVGLSLQCCESYLLSSGPARPSHVAALSSGTVGKSVAPIEGAGRLSDAGKPR